MHIEPQQFTIGDVVEFIGSSERPWKQGQQHIIIKVIFTPPRFKYATDRGAWFENSDFKLVHKADQYSLRAALIALDFEEELD